jgi:hypothetical protein
MPTYAGIKAAAKEIGGFNAQSCWIAHVKEQMGLHLRQAPNRRKKPCPPEKKSAIVAAMRRLKMI